MSHVEKRGKMWYAYWTGKDGKRHSKSVSKRKRDAEEFLLRIDASNVRGSVLGYKPVPFDFAAREWMETVAPLKLGPATLRYRRASLENQFIPRFGRRPVGEISAKDCDEFAVHRIVIDGVLGATAQHDLCALSAVMEMSVARGYALENPVAKATKLACCDREVSEMNVLSARDLRRLIEATPPRYRCAIAVAGMTGMRSGEVRGLYYSDFDMDAHLVHVQRAVKEDRSIGALKTPSSNRYIDVPSTLERMVVQWQGSPLRPRCESGLLFPMKNGKPMTGEFIRDAVLRPTLERAGLPRMRMHDLRHSYASILIANGESLKYVQEMLGHTSITITANVYAHLLKETHRSAATRLDEAVFGTEMWRNSED